MNDLGRVIDKRDSYATPTVVNVPYADSDAVVTGQEAVCTPRLCP